jgi:TnpA family transposase
MKSGYSPNKATRAILVSPRGIRPKSPRLREFAASQAPRFKNLKRQRLYISKSRRGIERSSWKIKPTGYVDDESAVQQWEDVLRLIATIKLKEVTASDLFRRLNSYSKQALKAFGQVLKSLFISALSTTRRAGHR